MKTLRVLLLALAVTFVAQTDAQTADEIIDTYFENIGGKENWRKVQGMKMTAKINQGGMEIPIERYQMKDGRQAVVINLQGQVFKQNVYDGEVLWGTNFQSMKAEKSDAEQTENFKKQLNDFPDPFLDYKDKGYTLELMGKEDFGGTECFKLKLVMEPLMIDGKEEESISYYYFDPDNFVPIGMHAEMKQGQAKGMIQELSFSDYQEVDGLYIPFSMTQGMKGGMSQPINMDTVELITEVDDSIFKFPEEIETEEKKDGNDDKN